MRFWRTKKAKTSPGKQLGFDAGAIGVTWGGSELPQSYLDCPGGLCEEQRSQRRAASESPDG